jgi:hypothetical protein
MSTATIEPGTRVRVYKNLNKSRAMDSVVYSVKDKRSGLVIDYVERITLIDAKFIVSEAGRQRVLRERRKNVHAYIEGIPSDLGIGEETAIITYNPYKFTTFVDAETLEPVRRADRVELAGKVRAEGIKGEDA